MARFYDVHADDVVALDQLRADLKRRRLDLGLMLKDAGPRVGREGEFVSMLERGLARSPVMSSLQLWASAVDARINFDLDGFWDVEHADPQVHWLQEMRRKWGKDAEMRLFLVAAIRSWRVEHQIPIEVVSEGIRMDRDGAARWEWEATDPLIGRAMVTARLVQTRVTMSLVFKEDWQG